jgi:hypothetical protein
MKLGLYLSLFIKKSTDIFRKKKVVLSKIVPEEILK